MISSPQNNDNEFLWSKKKVSTQRKNGLITLNPYLRFTQFLWRYQSNHLLIITFFVASRVDQKGGNRVVA